MKKFDNEFKANAVKLVREEGLKIGDVASDLGIGVSTLEMWLSKHDHGRLIKLKVDKGSWYNPTTEESLHPDLDHPPPKKPHWDYEGPSCPDGARLNIDGTIDFK